MTIQLTTLTVRNGIFRAFYSDDTSLIISWNDATGLAKAHNIRIETEVPEFTDKEKAVLKSLISGLYAEPGFSDVTVSDLITDELNSNAVRGFLSSLTEKTVVWSDDEYRISTDSGNMDGEVIIYLGENFYGLHKEWAADKGVAFLPVAGIND